MSHVLVTGANRGIGLEFVRQLLARGERVVAACRQPGRALELTRLAGAHPGHLAVLPLALPEARSIAELVREIESLDLRIGLLVNNAGMLVEGERFGTIASAALRDSFTTNVEGPLLLTQALAPRFAPHAKIVNISSGMGSIGNTQSLHSPSYAISKAALNMATRLLAHALAPHALVVALSPGWVRTDMGGANAPLTPQASVAAMLRTIDGLTPSHSGAFLSESGKTIAW